MLLVKKTLAEREIEQYNGILMQTTQRWNWCGFVKNCSKKSMVTQKEQAIEKYDKVLYGFENTSVFFDKTK